MNKVSIALFINGTLGERILKYLLTLDNIKISQIVLNSPSKRSGDYVSRLESIIGESNSAPIKMHCWMENMHQNIQEINSIGRFDFGISAFFGHLLPLDIIELAKTDFCNLHPSLLPMGRGAHPIPWSVIDSLKQGVSIHRLAEGLDQGDIFIQKEINTDIGMNSGEIYEVALDELHQMFIKFFPNWISNNKKPIKQDLNGSTFHFSTELEDLRNLRFDESGSFETFIRRIQGVTFSETKGAVFVDKEGNQWSLKLNLKRIVN